VNQAYHVEKIKIDWEVKKLTFLLGKDPVVTHCGPHIVNFETDPLKKILSSLVFTLGLILRSFLFLLKIHIGTKIVFFEKI